MKDSTKNEKETWGKGHEPPDFKRGELVLVSALSLRNMKGQKKLKDSFTGPFIQIAQNVPNPVQQELTHELMKKLPAFPVGLMKTYSSSDKESFNLRNKPQLEIPPLEE
ncbi:hypothetical protein O181_123238 [Austropuccinia psidii MF-1]|uniref:Uncharacterized protein n=1 Tax=Austropuccinia psidii MF-1 TaxID=1389203 RepID=A0A9Q3KLC1_9BASI|nr:hypothetical protein [Austropuccinia psidii MF-1]